MLETLSAPNHVAAFRVADTISGEDYARIERELDAKLAQYPRIGVYVDLTELRGIQPRALVRDVRYGLARRKQLDRFARNALVTDKAWLGRLVDAATFFMPAIEARVFTPNERTAAMDWAGRLPVLGSRPPALGLIETTRPDTFAFEWSGKLTRKDVERAITSLKPAFEAHDGVRILARLTEMGGVEPNAVLQSGFFSFKLLALRKLERYAVVGGPSWMSTYVKVLGAAFGRDVRHFAREREHDAWRWLDAQPRRVETIHA